MLEKSAGVIIYHRGSDKIEYLLLKHELGHWDFAKGHIEEGESLEDTARRELEEETGISGIRLMEKFNEHIQYRYKWEGESRFKVVTFFLAESETKRVKISEEHLEYRWATYEEAIKLCNFKNQRDLLKKANNIL